MTQLNCPICKEPVESVEKMDNEELGVEVATDENGNILAFFPSKISKVVVEPCSCSFKGIFETPDFDL